MNDSAMRDGAGRIALAAGGTGGHMFPAQALAEELLARGQGVVLITDRRGGGFGAELPQVETHRISAGGIAGTSIVGRLRNILRLGLGGLQARRLLKRLAVDTVVGFGGYPSVPTVFAASQLGLRVLLHEQNAVLGRANRLLASRAERIATSFHHLEKLQDRDRGKVVVTGNPVRPAITAIGLHSYAEPAGDDDLRLLITGGSQGARVFNDMVPDAHDCASRSRCRATRWRRSRRPTMPAAYGTTWRPSSRTCRNTWRRRIW